MKKSFSVAGIIMLVALSISTANAESGDRTYPGNHTTNNQMRTDIGTGYHSESQMDSRMNGNTADHLNGMGSGAGNGSGGGMGSGAGNGSGGGMGSGSGTSSGGGMGGGSGSGSGGGMGGSRM